MAEDEEKKGSIPLPKILGDLTDKVIKIEPAGFKHGCSWAVLLVLAYVAVFAVVLFFLNKDLQTTARAVSHGNIEESFTNFFTILLPVILLDIAIIALGLVLLVPIGKVATTFVINAPAFGFKRTWPVWLAMLVIVGGIAIGFTIHSKKKPIIIWRYETRGAVRSAPAVDSEGNIYFVSDDKYLYALNSSGLRRWRHELGKRTDASPVVGLDATIYFGSKDTVYALTSDGKYKWKYYTGGRLASTPAAGSDGTIYFLCNFTFYILTPWQPPAVRLYAFNPSGQLVWDYLTAGEAKSPPAVGSDGTVYFVTSKGFLYAVAPHGELKWRYPSQNPLEEEVHSSLVIDDDGSIYFGCDDHFLYAVTSQGELKWCYETDAKVQSSAAIGTDGTVYFGSADNFFYALTPIGDSAVEPKWRFETGGPVLSSPAIGSDGLIYFGSNDYHLYGITSEGGIEFDEIIGGKIQSSPLITSEGIIYVGSNNKSFYAVRPPSRNLHLADTPWPEYGHDNRNSGNAAAE